MASQNFHIPFAFIKKAMRNASHYIILSFQMKTRLKVVILKGNALSLLQTQFAKKPKNPV